MKKIKHNFVPVQALIFSATHDVRPDGSVEGRYVESKRRFINTDLIISVDEVDTSNKQSRFAGKLVWHVTLVDDHGLIVSEEDAMKLLRRT